MRELSITLSHEPSPGHITFLVRGPDTKQIDGTGELCLTHHDFEQAVFWVLEQVDVVINDMSGKIIDGWNQDHFREPWHTHPEQPTTISPMTRRMRNSPNSP